MLTKFAKGLLGALVLSGIGTLVSSPSYASDIRFSCETNGGLPTTVARNVVTGASLPVVKWYSEYFSASGYDPVTRCQQVSGRFQTARNSGALNYITAGIVNGLPVVCATSAGGSCNQGNVLFTLKPGTDAASTLQRIFDVRDLGAGPLFEADGSTYIDVNKLLAPLNKEGTSGNREQPSGNQEQPSSTPTNPGRNF
jgi:hypothetical protein